MPTDIAIDLGSSNTIVYKKGEGIVVKEPSVAACRSRSEEVLFTGDEALQMVGRTPSGVKAVRPLKNGAITNFEIARRIFAILFQKAGMKKFTRPRVVICVPHTITPVERRALVSAIYKAGASEVYLINQSVAAALGCELNIGEPAGNMVLDIGGGTTESVIMSLNQVVAMSALKTGSARLDEAIQKYLKDSYNLSLGKGTAEKIKKVMGSADNGNGSKDEATENQAVQAGEVKGMDLATNKPRNIKLAAEEVGAAMEISLNQIVESCLECIRKVPPELNRDISKTGIYMVGGGSLLNGLGQRIAEAANVPAHIMPLTQERVIMGAGACLESLKDSQKFFLN